MHTPRTRPRSAAPAAPATPAAPRVRFEPIITVAIEAVTPSDRGLTLTGQGSDRAEYRLDVHFELPLDPRTRRVLGELLSQSDVTVARRANRNS